MRCIKNIQGSILLEAIISLLILSFIVLGSFYSYSFVHQRVQHQRQHRMALSLLQGFMEEIELYIANDIATYPEGTIIPDYYDKNDIGGKIKDQFQKKFIDTLKRELETEDVTFDMYIKNFQNRLLSVNLTAEVNNMPILLFTQINTEKIALK